MYLTKVWGFGSPVGPLQFSSQGWRHRAKKRLHPGDLVVLVGTLGPPTHEGERGRILGLMEPSMESVLSLDFDIRPGAEHFKNGKYKWPYGLHNKKAWTFLSRPLLNQISDRQFYMDAVLGIVPLTDDEAKRILALEYVEAPLLLKTEHAKKRHDRHESLTARYNSPPPSNTMRTGIMHMRRAPAYTYAMEILGAKSPSYKIGWAFDFNLRAHQFNRAALPELGGIHYKPVLYEQWGTARDAYGMEQTLLEHFSARRHTANHEILTDLSEADLTAAWINYINGKL